MKESVVEDAVLEWDRPDRQNAITGLLHYFT